MRAGVELALTLLDTAEMYADDEGERLVGEALRGRREQVFLVSKAYPQNASRERLPKPARRACSGSGPTGSTSTCCTGAAASR